MSIKITPSDNTGTVSETNKPIANSEKLSQRKLVKPKITQTLRQQGVVLVVIKSVHTLIFFSVEFCVLYFLYSGLTGRVTRLTRVAFGVGMCESLVFIGN